MKNEDREKARVGVVIPCYNDGKYIDDAIQSVVAQTYQDREIVVVDDGSDDPGTVEKIETLKYPKTTLCRIANRGVSGARNYGIKTFGSEFILLLDADDAFEKTFLEKAVRILDENKRVGVVTCYERCFDEHDFEKTLGFNRPEGGKVEDFLVGNQANASALIRRECWRVAGGFDEGLRSHEDWDFWIRVTKNGWSVYSIPEILFHYRRSGKSKYKKNLRRKPDLVRRIVENHLDLYREHVTTCLYEKEKEILRLREEYEGKLDRIKKSFPYKVASYMRYPLRFLKSGNPAQTRGNRTE